ncbi:MAG TPA: DNA cytosine methyltransferase [Candidatus Limnocylindrales bacterium]|nr:DNA cytosine methyltransferase [Candidatus Limnocylindrales bacterium]
MISYISVCSGIEAATVAWHPLGWRAAAFSEIEQFPAAVLGEHYPNVPNRGDMTKFKTWPDEPIDLLVGGTPCQAFSIAGLRKGLDDPRGNLTLVFLALARKYRTRWVVWENVPGVLSDRGNAFGQFLFGLGQLGYGWAYRVLDAQYFGVPQRRRRVFVVGYLGDWRRAAAVLFEPESLRGDSAPRREPGQRVAGTVTRGALDGSSPCGGDGRDSFLVTHALRAEGFDASEDGTGRGTPLVPIAFSAKDYGADAGELSPTLRAGGHTGSHANGGVMPAVAFQECVTGVREYPEAGTLRAGGPGHDPVGTRLRIGMSVRRVTPRECERLQGFPDDYTRIMYRGKLAADGPRYKALGNSMAVPVMRWIGQRIAIADTL